MAEGGCAPEELEDGSASVQVPVWELGDHVHALKVLEEGVCTVGRIEDGALDVVNSTPILDEYNLEPEEKLSLRRLFFILAGDVAVVVMLPWINALHQSKQLANGIRA